MLNLPPHFQREAQRLREEGIDDWGALAALGDGRLRQLAASGFASEQRLVRLRGQARLVVETDLAPEQAALLLHAGIASCRGLAEASPERLLVHLGRLERSLMGSSAVGVDRATVQEWIARARRRSGRSRN